MRIWNPTSRLSRIFVLGLALALPPNALGEDNSANDALREMAGDLNRTQQQLANDQQNLANKYKQLVQQEAQAKEDKARRKQQQTAAALAGVGAAIAGVGCIMGMRAAQQQTDPSLKMMMMSQAMQQCSQAAQSAANAAKNDSGQSKLANNSNDPTQAPLEKFEAPTTAPIETFAPEEASSPTPSPSTEIATGGDQNPDAFEPKPTNTPSTLLASQAGTDKTKDDGKSELPPIPEAGTTYDESAKAGANSVGGDGSGTGSGGIGSLVATLSGKGSVEETLNKLTDLVGKRGGSGSEGDAGGGGGPEGGGAGSAAPGGEGTEKEGGEKDSSFGSMLAGIMGGGAAGASAGGGPREDIVWRPATGGGATATGQKPPNIFQYASYRMKKMSKEGVVARTAKNTLAKNAPAQPSQPSKRAPASVKAPLVAVKP